MWTGILTGTLGAALFTGLVTLAVALMRRGNNKAEVTETEANTDTLKSQSWVTLLGSYNDRFAQFEKDQVADRERITTLEDKRREDKETIVQLQSKLEGVPRLENLVQLAMTYIRVLLDAWPAGHDHPPSPPDGLTLDKLPPPTQ